MSQPISDYIEMPGSRDGVCDGRVRGAEECDLLNERQARGFQRAKIWISPRNILFHEVLDEEVRSQDLPDRTGIQIPGPVDLRLILVEEFVGLCRSSKEFQEFSSDFGWIWNSGVDAQEFVDLTFRHQPRRGRSWRRRLHTG